MASLWHSFVEAVTPGHDLPGQGGGGHHNHTVGGCPLSCEPVESHVREACSRSSSDHRGVPGDPNVTSRKLLRLGWRSLGVRMRKSLRTQGSIYLLRMLLNIPQTRKQAPIPHSSTSSHLTHSLGVSQGGQGEVHCKGIMDHANLIENAKFYQDTALNYQNAYEALHAQQVELQGRYSAQASLIEEALAAVKAVEAEAQQRHEQLLDVQHGHQVEIEAAVSRAVEQYKVQLSNAQSSLQTQDHEHQLVIQKLQSKV